MTAATDSLPQRAAWKALAAWEGSDRIDNVPGYEAASFRHRPHEISCRRFYARPAIRLAALMELPTIFVFTHDAMGDGEDGPTHQPIEQLASLRAIPGLTLLRPGDANEVVEAYRYVMQLRHRPALLVLSRRPLPTLDRSIATGSEVSLAVDAHERLIADGIRSRVVSMPSWDIFERETQEYRDSVLPPRVTARVAIEQASTFGWERYVGTAGRVIGMHTFGASALLKALQQEFGFTVENVMATVKSLLRGKAA
jgi:transketolase